MIRSLIGFLKKLYFCRPYQSSVLPVWTNLHLKDGVGTNLGMLGKN